ncbi:NADPH:quinone oxidoreductase family protein [Aquisediminimonas profunda]|uniref:NADPH:quinone oxidoreductase family protein n=1 Tax=Aquisediminimonas profunda TaxID=1550733 RepID=UPI001C635A69|nr:NADPH:quinone oxidoreductase family protein [Aquisediminimonas profunda]
MSGPYRAAVCTALTGPDSIQIQDRVSVPLDRDEVRIATRAAGVNFPDLLMTYGKYQFRPDPPFIPGMEIAGEVIETGTEVAAIKVGDRVMAGAKGGCFAEQLVVPCSALMLLPPALSFEEGSCWRSAAVTAWHALHDKAGLQAGETALILGASGGVGMAAVKLAKHIGATVIGTGSSQAKRDAILAAGADHALDPAEEDLSDQVKALTGGKGVNVVFDPVGGALSIKATRSIAWGGRFLIVGFASGEIPSFPANHALIKGYSLIGLRAGEASRRDSDLALRTQASLRELAATGAMRPHISQTFKLESAADALRALETRTVIGRAVITMA